MLRSLPPAGSKMRLSKLFSNLLKGLITPGPDCLRNAVASYTKIQNVFLVSQGRAALTLILQVLATESQRRKVVVPSYTCYTVPAAVVRAGLQIFPVDIDPCTLDFDRKRLEEVDPSEILAIVPSNLFGIPNDLSYLETYTKERGIWLVDDAAQAFGARVDDRMVGTFGKAGFYSLSKGKSFTTLGGGILVTRDEGLANRLSKTLEAISELSFVKAFSDIARLTAYTLFLNPSLYWIVEKMPFLRLGESVFNPDFRIEEYNDFLSHIGAFLVGEVDRLNRVRRHNAAFLIERLLNHDKIKVVSGYERTYPIYTRLPILIRVSASRDRIFGELSRQKLGASMSYPTSVNEIPGIGRYLCIDTANPNGQLVAQSIITLPTHAFVRKDDLTSIIDIIERNV